MAAMLPMDAMIPVNMGTPYTNAASDRQFYELAQGIGASACGLRALDPKMLTEERLMLFPGMEMMGRQYRRKHRHVGIQLHLHQAFDHCLGDELVTIDTPVDHQTGGDDPGITTTASQ